MRGGEPDEFDAFFAALWPRVFRAAYGVTGDAHLAEDAAQVAFAKAFAHWERVLGAQNPNAYVARIAVNEALGMCRRAWWRAERGREVTDRDARGTPDATDLLGSRSELVAALRLLPPRQRAVVVLRYYTDLSEEATADVLRCSRGTVKSQASKALARLRQHLGAAGHAEGEAVPLNASRGEG